MARIVDREVLLGFVEEAKSYLPLLTQDVESYRSDPADLQKLAEAHRHVHTIKGAAAMVGFAGLSHIAYQMEDALEELGAGQLDGSPAAYAALNKTVELIACYLDGIVAGNLQEATLVAEATRLFRQLHGLPAEEIQAAVELALSALEPASAQPVVAKAPPPAASTAPAYQPARNEIAPDLLEAFSQEAEDHLRAISTCLAAIEKEPDDHGKLSELRRVLHTLKGAAGAVGFRSMAQLAHRMEDLLDQLKDGALSLTPEIGGLLFDAADLLTDLLTDLLAGSNAESEPALQQALAALYPRFAGLLQDAPKEDITAPSARRKKIDPLEEEQVLDLADTRRAAEPEVQPSPPSRPGASDAPAQMVRVPIDRLNELVNLVSEIVISRTSLEQRMGDLGRTVQELRSGAERLRRVTINMETRFEASTLGRGVYRPAPASGMAVFPPNDNGPLDHQSFFDALEFDRYTEFHLLMRELTESSSDMRTVGGELNTLLGDLDTILNRQSRLSSELQEKLMRTRMVPLVTLTTRFHRAVRVLARDQGKLVDLVIEGESVELDKTVLEEMADPLLHLLRNAVDHGIEPPALRKVVGKPERGQIVLRAFQQGNQIIIQVQDDGSGLEPELLRIKAVQDGYYSEADAAQLAPDEIYGLIFQPGFSTASQVSEVSGRGVGLDVVKANVHRLKGVISFESTPGQGVTFTIRLPMTMAIMRALLVKANTETFAIPLNAISQILRLEREEVDRLGNEPVLQMGGRVYPLLRLGDALHLQQPADESVRRLPALILNIGGEQIALAVDHLIEGREIVVKSLGNHLRQVHGIAGATLMGDGSVVLIVNPADLISERAGRGLQPRPAARRAAEALNILIVDDSVSVRSVLSNLVKSAGWQAITAKDGLDALEILHSSAQKPDLVLLDIEMPRMDGYELLSMIRSQAAFQDIPVVILTSRAGEKHRRRALELGASSYLAKPYQDEVLLEVIRQQTQPARRRVDGLP